MRFSKPIIAAGCFITAAINIYKCILGYRKNRRPSAMRIVFALISAAIGILTVMSERVDRAHMKARAAGEGAYLDDAGFEDDIPDEVEVCFDDCAEWEYV